MRNTLYSSERLPGQVEALLYFVGHFARKGVHLFNGGNCPHPKLHLKRLVRLERKAKAGKTYDAKDECLARSLLSCGNAEMDLMLADSSKHWKWNYTWRLFARQRHLGFARMPESETK